MDQIELPKLWNAKLIKIINLAVITAGLFIFDWWLINLALHADKRLDFWVWPSLITALAIAVLSFFALVNNNKLVYYLLNLVVLAAYIAFMPKDRFVLAGGICFLILFLWFEKRIRAEEKSRVDFSMRRVLSGSITTIIYGLLLMLGFNIYYNTSNEFKANPDAFYDELGRSAAKSVPIVSRGFDRVDFNQTLDQFLVDEERESQMNKEEIRAQFLRQFGVQASGSESLSEIVARAFTTRIKEAAKPYEKFFPLIFTLIILGLLRTFAFVFRWLTLFIIWLLFRILLWTKFFKIEMVPVEVKKLSI